MHCLLRRSRVTGVLTAVHHSRFMLDLSAELISSNHADYFLYCDFYFSALCCFSLHCIVTVS